MGVEIALRVSGEWNKGKALVKPEHCLDLPEGQLLLGGMAV